MADVWPLNLMEKKLSFVFKTICLNRYPQSTFIKNYNSTGFWVLDHNGIAINCKADELVK